MSAQVINFNKQKTFTLESARELLPVIYRVTLESQKHVSSLVSCLEAIREESSDKARELEARINQAVEQWQGKMKKLGVEGKGLWLVDFDAGNGYFCWKYPETSLDHFHSYTEGFQARVKVN